MGGRRRFLRTTLAALVTLVLLAGIGAAVWVASSDDDEPPLAIAEAPAPEREPPGDPPAPADEPTVGDEPAPDGDEPAPDGEEPAPAEPEPSAPTAEAPSDPAPTPDADPAAPDRTRFPRERGTNPDRRGRRFSVPPAHRFTGTGNALIGTVDVRRPALVRWTARGRFGLEFGRAAFPIIAPSRSGQLVVPPYRFHLVRVLASGRWTITVTPQP